MNEIVFKQIIQKFFCLIHVMQLRFIVLVAMFFVTLPSGNSAENAEISDATLKMYLQKSEVVVVGAIDFEPELVATQSETGMQRSRVHIEVEEVLYANRSIATLPKKKDGLQFIATIADKNAETHPPLLKKGRRCVVFLKAASWKHPYWITADPQFGVQSYNQFTVDSLRRFSNEK